MKYAASDKGGAAAYLKVRQVSEGTGCADIDRIRKVRIWNVFDVKLGAWVQAQAIPLSCNVVCNSTYSILFTLLFSSQGLVAYKWVHILVMQVLLDERGDADVAIDTIIAAETQEAEFSEGRNGNHSSSSTGFVNSGKSLSCNFLGNEAYIHRRPEYGVIARYIEDDV